MEQEFEVKKSDKPAVWVPPKGLMLDMDERGELRGRLMGVFSVEKYADDDKTELIEKVEGTNLFVTSGITELWNLIIGASANVFNNTNSRIGVGDSATAPAIGQTDLLAATNKTYLSMTASYPQMSGANVLFRADAASGVANYAWNELCVRHNTSNIMINRSTNSGSGWGTKVAGTTWTVTSTLSLT